MNTDHSPTRRRATRDLSRITAVVCAHVGSNRSAVGLALAREIHRPCVDAANASFAAPTRVPTDEHDDLADVEMEWFESVVGLDVGKVVVAPCTVLPSLSESPLRQHLWVAWLDVDSDQVVREAHHELDHVHVGQLQSHLRRHAPFVAACDAQVDATGRTVDDIAGQLGSRFRALADTEPHRIPPTRPLQHDPANTKGEFHEHRA